MKCLGYLRQYINLLQAWQSGDRFLVGAIFSAPVRTGSEVDPVSYTMGDVSFLGVNQLGRVENPPPLAPRLKRE